jgi:hypothetical protein
MTVSALRGVRPQAIPLAHGAKPPGWFACCCNAFASRGVLLSTSSPDQAQARASGLLARSLTRLAWPRRGRDPLVDGVADRFRQVSIWLVIISCTLAIAVGVALHVRVNSQGAAPLYWLIAALLLVSRMWWERAGHQRIADVLGTVALGALGGSSCGALAMLGLRFQFPVADGMLQAWDSALGFNGLAVVEALLAQGRWIFLIMAPAYNYTLEIFLGSLILLALLGDRIEAWRAVLCFVGTLLTTCLIAAFVPAKGIGVWASPDLLQRLPDRAMRTFWPQFDHFYFDADPILHLRVIDGVISFPSFHTVVGFLTLAMWRKNVVTFILAAAYLTFMLLATVPGGGHYVVDLLGGFVVWAAWFAGSRHIEKKAGFQAELGKPNQAS